MKKNKENKILLIILLLVGVTSIGYAFLTTSLNIVGTSKIKNAKWDVHFENIVIKEGSVTPTKAATIENDTAVSFNVDLTKPKDYYEFDVDVVNNGTIDAMRGSIKKEPVLTPAQEKYLTYEVKYSGIADLHEKDSLPVGDKKTLNVFLKFREDINKEDLPKNLDTLTINYQIDYVQADKTAKKVDCKFTINLNGGKTVEQYNPSYLSNQEIMLKKPTKSGYKFAGWEVVSGDGRINDNKLIMGSKDTVIKAKWEALPVKYCTYNPEGGIKQGTAFVNGQYTYVYKQEKGFNELKNIDEDGWGVYLTDPNSTAPVTDEVCTYINNKPVVSMSYMFFGSKVPSIDLNKINTSQVTNMKCMFEYSQVKEIDLSSFDTSNVIDMNYIFAVSQPTKLDLSSFDTSKVNHMEYMFHKSKVTKLDLSNFDTSNVTNMDAMFSVSETTNIDLSSFNTSQVINMHAMFAGSQVPELDLSSFDTSNVTDMSYMFDGSKATTGYARNQIEADKFNDASVTSTPRSLHFVVKPQA